ncbi:SRPBCC family protein [Brucella sp. NM4]|uniref:SRPBCC family protein n=1 Tax=Brucella/Ochrobactrum group TaxID=2826938 RepID=UPI0024BCD95C|nr:SRPBCC family protein [Brucella sp. NM4]WHS30110.1 SRPBCC family protein [Brucella sp. NM4]WHT44406.1 SRPBCC family protein [Ochrobactrum sp. SSR]
MKTVSYTLEINPEGVEPVLTADQVWKGLEMKANNALPFVPGMSRCDVISRSDNGLLRQITLPTGDYEEKITFFPPVQVQFERVGSDGFIQNTISESEKGLWLTFTFSVPFAGASEGSDEELVLINEMRRSYITVVVSTLKKVRELVSAGKL